MEHDFIYLPDSRRYLVRLSSEQHALERFLLDEFTLRANAYQKLVDDLTQLHFDEEYHFAGREYSLWCHHHEIKVQHHSLLDTQEPELELELGMSTEDASLSAECGLEDLLDLLIKWQQFLPK